MATSYSTLGLDYIPDHDDRLVRKLPSHIQTEAERLVALVSGLGAGVQLAEDYLFGVLDLSTLFNARGEQLEQWGDLVGEKRGPLSDGDYLRFIRARLQINRWHDAGTRSPIDSMLDIYATIMGTSTVLYINTPPACFELVAVRDRFLPDPQADRVIRAMLDATPAGVRLILTEALAPTTGVSGSPLATLYASGGLCARRLTP